MNQADKLTILAALTLMKDDICKHWEEKTSNGRYDPYGKPDTQAVDELRQAIMKGGLCECQTVQQ